jgi:transaldolase
MYKELFASARFRSLEQHSARKQWLLWGSTSTKTKEYSDVKYVEALIGPETVNTMPLETLEAYRDHGSPALRLEQDVDRERDVFLGLAALGIDMNEIARRLEEEGIDKFVQPFEKLLRGITEKVRSLRAA